MKKISVSIFALLLVSLMGCSLLEMRHAQSGDMSSDTRPSGKHALSIRHLRDIQAAPGDTANAEDAYIIVHPSYYLFFQKKPYFIEPSDTKNITQSFVEMDFPPENTMLNLMKFYESREIAFLASARSDKRLVILVIPGKYELSRSYLYKKDDENNADEYARYINEATTGADTVLFLESENTNSGKVARQDMEILIQYLKQKSVQNIFIGGGYVGRCQEEFYRALSKEWGEDSIALMPELSAFSPSDITDATAKMLLMPDLKLNVTAANYFIRNGGIKKLSIKPNLKTASNIKVSLVAEKTDPAAEDSKVSLVAEKTDPAFVDSDEPTFENTEKP